MSLSSRLSLLALLLTGSGCATLRAECPVHEGPAWHDVRTEHFRVQTDLTPESAREAGLELERLRRALTVAFTRTIDPPGQLQVLLLRNPAELAEFAGRDYAGLFSRTGTRLRFALASDASLFHAGSLPTVQRHELSHYLMSYVFLRQPRWFAEGMAQYLETAELADDGTTVSFGRPSHDPLRFVSVFGVRPLAELWEWGHGEEPTGTDLEAHYASSWLWVHFLMNEYADPFDRFMRGLSNAQEPRRAFEEAFSGVRPEQLQAQASRYVHDGKYRLVVQRLTVPKAEVHLKELGPAEVHAARATLALMALPLPMEQRQAAAQKDVAQALALDPRSAQALLLQAGLEQEPASRLQLLRDVVQAHPDNGEAWQDLAAAVLQTSGGSFTDEAITAVKRAAELLPDDGLALAMLAMHELNQRHPDEALALSARAAKQAPWSPEVLDARARIHAALGYCEVAVALQQRLLDVLPERASAEVRAEVAAGAERYRTQCRPALSPAVRGSQVRGR